MSNAALWYRRVSVQGKLATEMGIQNIATLGDFSLLNYIHHTGQALALVHWVSNESLRAGSEFDGLNRLLICRLSASAM